jgi:hypothetical protein
MRILPTGVLLVVVLPSIVPDVPGLDGDAVAQEAPPLAAPLRPAMPPPNAVPRRVQRRRRRLVRIIYINRPLAVTPTAAVEGGARPAPPPERLKAAPARTLVAPEPEPGAAPAPARLEPFPPPPARLDLAAPPPPPSRNAAAPPSLTRPPSDDQPPPNARARYDLMGGGVALFLAAWGADVGATYGFHAGNPTRAFIPVAGPILQLGDRYGYAGPALTSGNVGNDTTGNRQLVHYNQQVAVGVYVALGADVAAQLAGLALVVIGPALHPGGRRAAARPDGKLHARVAPTANGVAVIF